MCVIVKAYIQSAQTAALVQELHFTVNIMIMQHILLVFHSTELSLRALAFLLIKLTFNLP